MSSAILNSNASSALISATNAVSSITNPFIYSYGNKGQLTSSAVPAHARIVSTSQTSNIGFSQNIDFQVLKSGFLESAFIKYTIRNSSGANAYANGLIGNLLLEEISLMTQGKIISHSTPFSRAARMSDAPYGRKKNLEQAYGLTAGEITIADGASKTFYVPLGLSCFDTPANFLNTSFLEPINIRIRTAGKSQYFGSHADPSVPVDLTMTSMELIQVFRMLDSAEEQKCIQANYSEDNLVSVEYDSICENTSFTPTAGLSRVASHVITTNRSIAKLYIAVESTVNPAAAVANTEAVGKYLELETNFLHSSTHYNDSKGQDKADRLINITKKTGYQHYINAIGGTAIYDKEYFQDKGIHLSFLDSYAEPYSQFNNEFIPKLNHFTSAIQHIHGASSEKEWSKRLDYEHYLKTYDLEASQKVAYPISKKYLGK